MDNILDSGDGSLRQAFSDAADGDTIFIDTKGVIELLSPILIEDRGALTIIGPYPKHLKISASGGWSGSLLEIKNSGPLKFHGLGFDGGTGTTRHIYLENCSEITSFERCLFQNSTLASENGGAIRINNSSATLQQCSFVNNSGDKGGAIFVEGASNGTIENCTFSGNHAVNSAGAIYISAGTTFNLWYNTIVHNYTDSGTPAEAVETESGSMLYMENNAIGFNGDERQFYFGGDKTSFGGNIIRRNSPEDIAGITLVTGDLFSYGVEMGLRTALLEDGFGLKYWPIVNDASNLINPKIASERTPTVDCRNAPRSLKGNTAFAYPDAGACEYTHLRITSSLPGDIGTEGTLIWALSAPQRKDQVHYIEFDIPGTPDPIALSTTLIATVEAYIFDGFSQPESAIPGPGLDADAGLTSADIKVIFSNAGTTSDGITFSVNADKSVLQGVRVVGFDETGVQIDVSAISVYGCEIGIDADGTANGNDYAGIHVNEEDVKIGGWEHWQRNVISGNGLHDSGDKSNIFIERSDCEIRGNIIGGAQDGVSEITASDTTEYGIKNEQSYTIIGGQLYNQGNIIVKNKQGIYSGENGYSARITSNKIGVGYDGTTDLGNGDNGILLNGADLNFIGSENTAHGNIIANNRTGVSVITTLGPAVHNTIIGNLIYNNDSLGIDLYGDHEVLENDGLIDGTGPNHEIDFPELISSISCEPNKTVTTYQLRVPTGSLYRVEFFKVTDLSDTHGEGNEFIGHHFVNVTTNPQTFDIDHGITIDPGESITATVTYVALGGTSEFAENIVVTEPGDSNFEFADFCPDSIGVPVILGDPGGEFRFAEPEIMDGSSIDAITGAISNAVEGTTYTVIYQLNICELNDTALVSVINVDESFTFDDFCWGAESPAPVAAEAGTYSFELTPADGATIHAEDGIIYNSTEAQDYSVIHTVTVSGCPQSDTLVVSTPEIFEAFVYDDICPEITGSPVSVETPGGVFSFVTDPGDGATISPDGILTGGVEGTVYDIQHTVTISGCADQSVESVAVIAVDESFVFDDFCPAEESPAPIPAIDDGTFSFYIDPGGGTTIDPITGIITAPVEGDLYTVIYTVTVSGCTQSDTHDVSTKIIEEAFEFEDFCFAPESPEPEPSEEGGVFSFGYPPSDEATIDPSTGIISGVTEGTDYVVVYTMTTDGCSEDDTVTVNAIGVNEAFTFEDYCPAVESPAPISEEAGGYYGFSVLPGDGASINSTTGVITNGVEGTEYAVEYTLTDETGSCAESAIILVQVIPTDESFTFNNFCAEFSGYPTEIETTGGMFAFAPDPLDGAEIDPLTGELSFATAGSDYPVMYTVGVCEEQDTIYVQALYSEDATFDLDNYCAGEEVAATLTGTEGGAFDFESAPTDGAIIDETTGMISNTTGGTYFVRYITEGDVGVCPDTVVQMITVHRTPVITEISSDQDLYCPEETLLPVEVTDYEDAFKVFWRIESPESDIVDTSFTFTPSSINVGENNYYAQAESVEGCLGETTPFSIRLSDISGMEAISDFDVCLGSPAYLEAYGGVAYTWHTDVPLSDYTTPEPVAFSLNEEVYSVSIMNNDGCEVMDSVKVGFMNRAGCNIELYNAFSPNEDGKNDFWYIEHLINYRPNKVYVYNRWGDLVNTIENYDNVTAYWDGNDKNGNKLPPNTYFYVVITDDSNQNQAGWVQLVR